MNKTMLYKPDGEFQVDDGFIDYVIVVDEDVDSKIAEGWFKTPPEAINSIPQEDAPKKRGRPAKAE